VKNIDGVALGTGIALMALYLAVVNYPQPIAFAGMSVDFRGMSGWAKILGCTPQLLILIYALQPNTLPGRIGGRLWRFATAMPGRK